MAGQRAGEGRAGAAAGWAALGLAGAVPFFGDVAQGLGRAGRVASQAADVVRSAEDVGQAAVSAAERVRAVTSSDSLSALNGVEVAQTPNGVPIPDIWSGPTPANVDAPLATRQRILDNIRIFDVDNMLTKGEEIISGYEDTVQRLRQMGVELTEFSYAGEAPAVSDRIILPSTQPLGVNNLYEAGIYWNNVGNKNIQSILRTGNVSDEADFIRALDEWDESPMSNMTRLEVINYFEEATQNAIRLIDDGMKNSVHPPFVAYRGINANTMADFLDDDFFAALQRDPQSVIGAEITDPGYFASSLSSREAGGFAMQNKQNGPMGYGYVFQVQVPENFNSLPISGNWEGQTQLGLPYGGEYEVLLPRDLTLEIVDVQTPQQVFEALYPNNYVSNVFEESFGVAFNESKGYYDVYAQSPSGSRRFLGENEISPVPIQHGLITLGIKETP